VTSLRGRLLAVAALALVLAVVLAAAGLVSSAASAPVGDGPVRIVPADALIWIEVRLGAPGERTLISHLPSLARARATLLARLGAMTGAGPRIAAEMRPWLGAQAGLALLPASAERADSLFLLGVRAGARANARRFLEAVSGARPTGRLRGIELYRYPGGTMAAMLSAGAPASGDSTAVLALGQERSVREAIAVQRGAAPSLARLTPYRRSAAAQPSGRILDAYASGAGLRALLDGRPGAAGAAGELLAPPSLRALGLAVAPAGGLLRVSLRSLLSPGARVRSSKGPAPFGASLADALPASTELTVDVADLLADGPRLLAVAGSLGIGTAVLPLLRRLGPALEAEGLELRTLRSDLSGQGALAVLDVDQRPAVLVVAHASHPAGAREQLAEAERALARIFSGVDGVAVPLFSSRAQDGAMIDQLQLTTGLTLAYTVFRHRIVIGTSGAALAQVVAVIAGRAPSLASSAAFREVAGPAARPSASLVFAHLRRLISQVRKLSLLSGRPDRELAKDLAAIRLLGARTTAAGHETTTELYLTIP
jgi:hypothetical protein